MDKLRRVIVHRSETGYMFSIKDLGSDYSEAAPVSKVIVNGPAYAAGLRPGDGLVAINSNLVKGKTHMDLYNIIKSCRISLELTVIENYFSSFSPSFTQNKSLSTDERKRDTDNSTPISIEDECFSESPIIMKKKAYTYDKAELERFSHHDEPIPKPYNSASDLFSSTSGSRSGAGYRHQFPAKTSKFQPNKPRISYKPAKSHSGIAPTAKSDLDIVDALGKACSAGPAAVLSDVGAVVNARITRYDRSKLVYHYAYKQSGSSSSSGGGRKKLAIDSQNYHTTPERRESSPSISESISIKSSQKPSRLPNSGINATNLHRKSSQTSQISKSNYPTISPKLQLNRVGGLVRAPLSVDETIDLDSNEADNSDMLYSVDVGITDHSSETGATNESGRSSCDLENLENSVKPKYRYLHCSPVPYKSTNITTSSSLPLEVTPKNETSHIQFQLAEDMSTKLPKKPPLIRSNSRSEQDVDKIDHDNLFQCEPNPDSSMEEYFPEKEEIVLDDEPSSQPSSKHFKKLKNILGDNYRGRSKTLDSDRKSKEDEVVYCPTAVMVKWIMYEGKTIKSSWKQYTIDLEDDRLVFQREINLPSYNQTAMEDTNMAIPLDSSIVEEEPEKRGRKNTLKIIHSGKQSECLIEFTDKSLATKWLFTLEEKSKSEKDDKAARTASFKERHSLTVPNLYGKESPISQNQFIKSKTKNKENLLSNANSISSAAQATFPQSNKSVIQQTMSRVKKLKHKFASSHVSEFERQQEEWFNRPSMQGKLVGSSSCSEDIHVSMDGSSNISQMGANDPKQLSQSFEYGHANVLPLHKWQRSITSYLIPLAVELCISIIENFGMNHVGLYRVSGNKIALDYICAELRKPVSEIDVATDKWNDLHAISGVLKSFFRNLSDGLFPKDLYSDIIGACRIHECDRERRLLSIQRFLSIMDIAQDHPEYRYHRETLRYLMEHLSRVASRHSTNRMNARNLAVIFAPTLMKPPQETNEILVNDYKYKIQLIETLIKHHKWLFSPTLESACNVPPDIDDDDIIRLPPSEDLLFPIDINDNKDTTTGIADARPLVKEILEKTKKISQDNHESLDNQPNSEDCGKTLAELSRQAYVFNSIDIGYKEVDIDEECEKRKCNNDKSVSTLKMTTNQILLNCEKDIMDLQDIQQQCRQDLYEINEKIQKNDQEILKTERIIETNSDKGQSKKIVSRLYDIPGRNLSNLSVVLATPKANPIDSHPLESGTQKTRLSSTEV